MVSSIYEEHIPVQKMQTNIKLKDTTSEDVQINARQKLQGVGLRTVLKRCFSLSEGSSIFCITHQYFSVGPLVFYLQ